MVLKGVNRPTVNFADQFYNLDDRVYLDAANHGPLPRTSVQAIKQAIELKKFPEQITNKLYFDVPNFARSRIAKLIGAQDSEIAITTGASTGIQIVASSLDLHPGDEVIVAADEFPANYYPWDQAQLNGLVVRWVRPKRKFLSADDYFRLVNANTRLIAASYVSYETGNRLDIGTIGEVCQERDIAFLVDGSQAVGAIPVNVKKLNVHFLVCCGYKWLLSPYGTGFFYVNAKWMERLRQPPAMWQAVKGADNFNELPRSEWQFQKGARRWDSPETASFFNVPAMTESVNLLLTIGPARIQQHIQELLRHLLNGLPGGVLLMSPADEERRGTFVCIASRTNKDTRKIWEDCRRGRIYVSLRKNTLRVAPHIYNTAKDIDAFLEYLMRQARVLQKKQ
jgi:cysteine desulfurase / selenocysteine lyase